jgi:Kef-type K+ transport system membrane component KefB
VGGGSAPPRLVLAWEGLSGPVQVVLSFPVLVVAFFLLHKGLFGLSTTRSLFYGVFWAIPGTAAVVVATKTEAAKRRHGARDGER